MSLGRGSARAGLICLSALYHKVDSLTELDEPVNSLFTRPPEQRWLLLYSWFL